MNKHMQLCCCKGKCFTLKFMISVCTDIQNLVGCNNKCCNLKLSSQTQNSATESTSFNQMSFRRSVVGGKRKSECKVANSR